MTIPTHTLHLYQKPKLGNGFIRRYPALQYTHKISAMGGFDTASCNIRLTVPEAEMALADWIGNRVAIFVDNPVRADLGRLYQSGHAGIWQRYSHALD